MFTNIKANRVIYKKIVFVFVFTLVVGLISVKNAYAYLDLGTFNYILQIAMASLLGAVFTLKIYWQRVKQFFKQLFAGKRSEDDA